MNLTKEKQRVYPPLPPARPGLLERLDSLIERFWRFVKGW